MALLYLAVCGGEIGAQQEIQSRADGSSLFSYTPRTSLDHRGSAVRTSRTPGSPRVQQQPRFS